MATTNPTTIIGCIAHSTRRFAKGEISDSLWNLYNITGKVKIWAKIVIRKFSFSGYNNRLEKLSLRWHSFLEFAKMMPKVAKKESWKERSFIKLKLNISIIPPARK